MSYTHRWTHALEVVVVVVVVVEAVSIRGVNTNEDLPNAQPEEETVVEEEAVRNRDSVTEEDQPNGTCQGCWFGSL